MRIDLGAISIREEIRMLLDFYTQVRADRDSDHDVTAAEQAFDLAECALVGSFGRDGNYEDAAVLWEPHAALRVPCTDALCVIGRGLTELLYQLCYEYPRAIQAPDVFLHCAQYDVYARQLALRWMYRRRFGKHVSSLPDDIVLAAYAAEAADDNDLVKELLAEPERMIGGDESVVRDL